VRRCAGGAGGGSPRQSGDAYRGCWRRSRVYADGCHGAGLDVLVNNAGIMPISPLDQLRVEDWEVMVDADPVVKAQLEQRRGAIAMPPDSVARAIAFAIEQPTDVAVGEVVIRATAHGLRAG
jgi:NADP-dependent 3-hydroxy acid dehydrogenase YdfG